MLKHRKLIYVSIFVLAVVFSSVILSSCSFGDQPAKKDDLSLKWREIWYADVTVSVDGRDVFSFSDPERMPQLNLTDRKQEEVKLSNVGDKEVTVHLCFGDTVSDITVAPNSEVSAQTADAPLSLSCIGITVNGRTAYYVSSPDALIFASERTECEAVIFIDDITFDGGYTVTSPIKLITNAHVLDAGGKLGIITEADGAVEIWNGDANEIKASGFFADAPNTDIYINKEFVDLGGSESFWLTARSYNSVSLNPNVKAVNSRKMLDVLLDVNEYPALKQGMTVRISDGFELSGEDAIITEPITLIFDGAYTYTAKLVFSTDAEGSIQIKNIGDGEISKDAFSFNAPNCDLSTYECDITIFDLLSEGLRSFRGVKLSDCTLGGDGAEKLIGIRMSASDNRNLAADVSWTVFGDYAFATVSCVVDPELLRHANLTAEVSGGTVSFASGSVEGTADLMSDTGCFCTVTDENGNIRRYAVMIEYIPTKLPVVVIDVKNDKEITSLEKYTSATIRIECGNLNGEYPSLAETRVLVRGRGNSTWGWPKKPYKLKFETKTSVLGMTANKDWVLLANYADKSLIRNHVALVMAQTLDNMPFATSQYPVDVFMNGKYLGVYTLGEQVEVKTGRVDIEVDDDTNILDTGYLLQIGGTTSEDKWDVTCFRTSLLRYVKIETPDDELLTRARVQFIKEYCLKADEAVMAGEGYEEYIDVDALIDWCILHELAYNLDSCFHRSCFIVKQAGGKLQMGPAWDFDLALGNMSRDYNKYDIWLIPGKSDEDAYIKMNWLNYLYTNEDFCRKMEARWNEIKDVLLENALNAVDEMGDKVTPSAKDNFELWQILGIKVAFEPSYTNQYNTYEKQLGYLRSFIVNRWNWIDENISKLPLSPEETDILPKTETATTAE